MKEGEKDGMDRNTINEGMKGRRREKGMEEEKAGEIKRKR